MDARSTRLLHASRGLRPAFPSAREKTRFNGKKTSLERTRESNLRERFRAVKALNQDVVQARRRSVKSLSREKNPEIDEVDTIARTLGGMRRQRRDFIRRGRWCRLLALVVVDLFDPAKPAWNSTGCSVERSRSTEPHPLPIAIDGAHPHDRSMGLAEPAAFLSTASVGTASAGGDILEPNQACFPIFAEACPLHCWTSQLKVLPSPNDGTACVRMGFNHGAMFFVTQFDKPRSGPSLARTERDETQGV